MLNLKIKMLKTIKTTIKIKIKKLLLLTAAFAAVLSMAGPAVCSGTGEPGEPYVPGDVLVVFRGEEGARVTAASLNMGREAFRVASIAASSGAWVKDTYADLSEAGNEVFALLHSDIVSTDALIEELLSRPDVLAASPNYIARVAALTDDPVTPSEDTYNPGTNAPGPLWGLEAAGVPEVWETGTTGSRDVHVAIIDTGIDATHPDLAANVDTSLCRNFYTDDTSDYIDENGHGTHVAGTIGAVGNNGRGIVGINWNVGIIALKVFGAEGSGALTNIFRALNYLASLLQSNPDLKLAAVNLSLTFYSTNAPTPANAQRDSLWYALRTVDKMNRAVIVVAAGNESVEVGVPTPDRASDGTYSKGSYAYLASYRGLDNKISVAALSSDLTLAPFSNWSSQYVEVAAPGFNIHSTFSRYASEEAQARYRTYTTSDGSLLGIARGTSMAAPHVSGAAALLMAAALEQYPGASLRTAWQIKTALLNGASESLAGAASSSSIFNIASALDYQNARMDAPESDISAVPPVTSESTEFDEAYNKYAPGSQTDRQTSSGGGGSGCAVAAPGALLLVLSALPLVRPRLRRNKKIKSKR